MTRRIAMLFGTPGVGKTTLAWRLIDAVGESSWRECEPIKLVHALYCERLDLLMIGRYSREPCGSRYRYAGVDRLAMNCQPNAKKLIAETASSVFVEGDRFSNASFVEFLITLDPGALILNLYADPDVVARRQRDRGDDRTDRFLRARETKYANIRAHPLFAERVRIMPNNDLEQHEAVWRVLLRHLEINR